MKSSRTRPFTEFTGKADREKDDLYITPDSVIKPLLKAERFEGQGWEPASGTGAISKFFPYIISSDIKKDEYICGSKGVDFLSSNPLTPYQDIDFIITNPPFKLALPFLKRSLQVAKKKVVLFLRIQFMTGKERVEFLRLNPPIRIHVFVGRPSCLDITGKALGTGMNFAWFVWEQGFKGRPTLYWMEEE